MEHGRLAHVNLSGRAGTPVTPSELDTVPIRTVPGAGYVDSCFHVVYLGMGASLNYCGSRLSRFGAPRVNEQETHPSLRGRHGDSCCPHLHAVPDMEKLRLAHLLGSMETD